MIEAVAAADNDLEMRGRERLQIEKQCRSVQLVENRMDEGDDQTPKLLLRRDRAVQHLVEQYEQPRVEDLAGLLGLVEIGVIEVHPWQATVDDIERPDLLVFDLDPGEEIEWEFVVETAFRLRKLLADEGLDCWPKTTGGKGLHIMVPTERKLAWNLAHDYTRGIAQRLAATEPDGYTVSAAISDRPGKLFIDYLRNGRGTTAAGTYSPRARPGFPIAAPVTWKDVERGVRPDSFTIATPPPQRRTAAGSKSGAKNTEASRPYSAGDARRGR